MAKTLKAKKVTVNLKQTLKRNKIGKDSRITNVSKGEMKFKTSVPFKVTINMKQTKKNSPGLALHQGGSIEIASAGSKKKEI